MKLVQVVVVVLIGAIILPGAVRAQTTPLSVYDVTNPAFDVAPGSVTDPCTRTRVAINQAILTAHESPTHGGTVYFPPGAYCVDDSIEGYGLITLLGASMAGGSSESASRIMVSPAFGANKSVIRMKYQNQDNYGFSVQNLGINTEAGGEGIVGVDFSGVWYGAIRGVHVRGYISPPPRSVQPGSIGFLFSDRHFSIYGGACFGNLVERTDVQGVETAYRFESTLGNETLNTMTNFWASDVHDGIWTSAYNNPSNSGSVGLTFRDGYMVGTLAATGKAFKHTSGFGASITTMNVQFEFFDEPNDLPIGLGDLALVQGNLYIGGDITGTNSLNTSGPIVGGSLSVTGNVSSGGNISGSNLSLAGSSANISGKTFTRTVAESPGYHCGAVASCPCFGKGINGTSTFIETTYAPPYTMSFWAAISGPRLGAPGTTLHPGANTFRFYTTVAITLNAVLPDLFLTLHPTHTANIGQVFQMSGTNTKDCPAGYWTQTFDVTIFVNTEVTLESDFVFFLEANQTKSESTPMGCGSNYVANTPTAPPPATCTP